MEFTTAGMLLTSMEPLEPVGDDEELCITMTACDDTYKRVLAAALKQALMETCATTTPVVQTSPPSALAPWSPNTIHSPSAKDCIEAAPWLAAIQHKSIKFIQEEIYVRSMTYMYKPMEHLAAQHFAKRLSDERLAAVGGCIAEFNKQESVRQ